MKINTINITEYNNDEIISVNSFSADQEGVKEAEELFKALAKSHDATDEEAISFLQDGLFETGSYQLFLTPSVIKQD